jgi:hypothetical protein
MKVDPVLQTFNLSACVMQRSIQFTFPLHTVLYLIYCTITSQLYFENRPRLEVSTGTSSIRYCGSVTIWYGPNLCCLIVNLPTTYILMCRVLVGVTPTLC